MLGGPRQGLVSASCRQSRRLEEPKFVCRPTKVTRGDDLIAEELRRRHQKSRRRGFSLDYNGRDLRCVDFGFVRWAYVFHMFEKREATGWNAVARSRG
jgi:hypothetical protein